MKGFFDNDYLLKIAACDLIEETLVLFALAPSDIYVLPTAKYKLRKDARGNLSEKYGVDGLARAVAFLETVLEAPDIDNEETALLKEAKDLQSGKELIDAGERVLLASSTQLDAFLFMTGDKRCLEGLAGAESCKTVHARHLRKVVCIEQTLLLLIESIGFDRVRQKAVPAYECDKALRSAFGSGMLSSESNVKIALQAYVSDLDQKTAGLLKLSL